MKVGILAWMCGLVLVQSCFSGEIGVLPKSVKDNYNQKKTVAHVLVDKDYYIWGMTVFKWKDGKYHAYYSRWPLSSRFGG